MILPAGQLAECHICKDPIKQAPSDISRRLKLSKSGYLFCNKDCLAAYLKLTNQKKAKG